MSEYIEREALIERLSKLVTTSDLFGMGVQSGFSHAITEAKSIPAADVEPVVRGTWVEMRDPYGDLKGWIHEECGRETNAATEYCSKCGAKMTFVERSGIDK